MIGVLVNVIAVILGSGIGLLCSRGIPERFSDAIMKGLALCTTYIGISGALKGENTIVVIVSVAVGAVIGTALDLDGKLNRLGDTVERKFFSKHGSGTFSRDFVTASLFLGVGAMAVVGSLNAGLNGDNEMLFTKSVLDFIASIMLTVSLGFGVMFSSLFILVFQGSIALLAGLIAPILSDAAVTELVCTGSLLLIGLGLNMLGVTKLKIADYLPSLIIAPVIIRILEHPL